MSNKLVDLIKKMSQTKDDVINIPDIPGITPTGPSVARSVSVVPGDPGIKKMQGEMQTLAKNISEHIDYKTMFEGMSQPQTADLQQTGKAISRDSFSNFMVNSYLRNSAVKGVEYDPNPAKSKINQKLPSDLKHMYTVLDSLQRIGTEAKESQSDGKWGQRTNNGLRNIIAIADSLVRLGEDFNFTSKSFDRSQLTELQSKIPVKDTDISLEDKKKIAPTITEYLRNINLMFIEFRDNVLNNPHYIQSIEGDKKFETYQKVQDKPAPVLNQNENTIVSQVQAINFNSLPEDYKFKVKLGQEIIVIITAADLVNEESLTRWANMTKKVKQWKSDPENWKLVKQEIVKQVRPQINSLMEQRFPAPKGI